MRSPDDTVRTMVTKLEQALHRDGWDQPARLFSVWQHREGALRIELVPIPIQSPPGEFMEYLAGRFTAGDEWAEAMTTVMTRMGRFYGFCFVAETWGNESLTPAEYEALPPGTSLADLPSSYESRTVHLVDVYGRIFTVHRRRGEKPRTQGWAYPGGRIFEALLAMVRAVAAKLPEDQADLAALLVLEPETLEMAQARFDAYQADAQGQGAWGMCRSCGDHTQEGEDPDPTLCLMCQKAEREA